MMYSMPPDTQEKEKIAFGLFDIRQIIWFSIFTVAGVVVTLIMYGMTGSLILGVLFLIPFVAAGIVFAVKKVEGLMLPTYIKLKIKHNRKVKFYINGGFHKKLEFSVRGKD